MIRPTLPALLAAVCLACGGGLLVACGSSSSGPDAGAVVSLARTAAATPKVHSGRLSASFVLAPDGLLSLGGPIAFRAAGPFAVPAAGGLAQAQLAISGSVAGRQLRLAATSTGKHVFLRLGGHDYMLDAAAGTTLLRSLEGMHGGGVATLGLHPADWITNPRTQGDATIGGVTTNHVTGGIAVRALLDDLGLLLGSAVGGDAADVLTPKLRQQIAAAVRSAKVDAWIGDGDGILRQLAAVVDFAFDKGSSPLPGLDGGRISLRLRLDDANATTFRASAPKHARPLSKLASAGDIGSLLGIGAGAFSATGAGVPSSAPSDAFLKCLRSAGAKAGGVARCAAALAP